MLRFLNPRTFHYSKAVLRHIGVFRGFQTQPTTGDFWLHRQYEFLADLYC